MVLPGPPETLNKCAWREKGARCARPLGLVMVGVETSDPNVATQGRFDDMISMQGAWLGIISNPSQICAP